MNTLTQNKKYLAHLELGTIEKFASNKMIADILTKEGLSNVQVTGVGKDRVAIGTATQSGPIPDKAKKYIKEINEIA